MSTEAFFQSVIFEPLERLHAESLDPKAAYEIDLLAGRIRALIDAQVIVAHIPDHMRAEDGTYLSPAS